MKRTPRLAFVADPAIVTGEAVETVLRRLVSERPSEAEGAEPEEP
jgi:ribosome-binding factor A